MSDINKNLSADSAEVADKALEAVSGGTYIADPSPESLRKFEELESKIDKDLLIKANKDAQILVDYEKSLSKNSEGSTQKMINLASTTR